MAINDLPHPGRFAHYVMDWDGPPIEYPALITGTKETWRVGPELSSDRHASMHVFGDAFAAYLEQDVPYSGPLHNSGDFKLPGTWHWWDECGGFNNHIE